MQLLIGTGNPAKLARFTTILRAIPDVEVVTPHQAPRLPPIAEDGATAEENACRKARTYADAAGLPTLSVDDALFFPALPPDAQPGLLVRRYGGRGRDATDEEALAHYLAKIGPLAPHQRQATWHYGICLALPWGPEFVDRATVSTRFVARPRLPLLAGYPLSSLQVDPASGKALRDLSPEEEAARLLPVLVAVRRVVRAALAAEEGAAGASLTRPAG